MSDINFDCKVCDRCGQAMTAAKYWNHICIQAVEPRKWEIKPVAKIKEDKNDLYIKLEEQLTDVRFALDDLYLEQETLEDRIREKELEIEDLEDKLAELEEEDNNAGC